MTATPETDARADLVRHLTELERQRFAAIVAKDYEAFRALAHDDLRYTHSSGVTDTLEEYLAKCESGFYDYHRIDHPVTEVLVEGDTALVLGGMQADLAVNGVEKTLDNASLAVWVRVDGSWKFLAYQPTPRA